MRVVVPYGARPSAQAPAFSAGRHALNQARFCGDALETATERSRSVIADCLLLLDLTTVTKRQRGT
jgi:hypothetical protein